MKKSVALLGSLLFLGVLSIQASSYQDESSGDYSITLEKDHTLVTISQVISDMASDVGGEVVEIYAFDPGLYDVLLLLKTLFDNNGSFDKDFVQSLSEEDFLNVVWAIDFYNIVPFGEFEGEDNFYLDLMMPRLVQFYIQYLEIRINDEGNEIPDYNDQAVSVQHRLLPKLVNSQFALSFKKFLFPDVFGISVDQEQLPNVMLLWDFILNQVEIGNLSPSIAQISYDKLVNRGEPYVTHGTRGNVILDFSQLLLWVNFEGVEVPKSIQVKLNTIDLLQTLTLDSFCSNAVNTENLRLYGANLTTLPDSVGNLTNLVKLVLFENNLTELPDSIGNLQNLIELDVRSNNITVLPDSIRNLNNLQRLYLSGNNFTEEYIENLKKELQGVTIR